MGKFSKTTKLHTHGGVQFVVFVKFTCAYLHQIVPEIMQLLMNNLPGKKIAGSQDRQNFDTSQAIFVICTHDYNFALVFHKKCTIFHPIRSTFFFHVHNYARKRVPTTGTSNIKHCTTFIQQFFTSK